jgi:predicted lactoylglutathione lyase
MAVSCKTRRADDAIVARMDQRISMITLPVADVPAARAFYERLGWTVTFTDGDIVMFQAGGMILSLWWRDKLDIDGGVADGGGYGHAALAYAVNARGTVDEVCREAVEAGASIAREPGEKPFGYSGVFADPDGHTWEVAWVRGWTVHDNGATTLPT